MHARLRSSLIVAGLLTGALFLTSAPPALSHQGSDIERNEPYRPQYHFSPAANWINDPNGLVWYRGEYHLFYQYNPHGQTWGNMSWGHAVSRDLVHWTELGVAIANTGDEHIFSGSIVVDERDTSGFGAPGRPAMVAVYTSWHPQTGIQAQSLAYSVDAGRTWQRYPLNPVLDIGSRDFRDPKVFWYQPGGYWVMAVALAVEHKIQLYRSDDLKSWALMSDFGPANAVGGAWEVPDLFKLPVDGDPRNTKWVLSVNLNPGAIAGGSGAQYFIGHFDGVRFTAENVVSDNDPPPGTVFADFEAGDYGDWTVHNDPALAPGPFGVAPLTGTAPGQLPVSGFRGDRLVNSFVGFDAPQGRLVSPTFTISEEFINLLVGGGPHPHRPGTGDGTPPDGEVLFDFETPGSTFESAGWTAQGGLADRQPAQGALPGQQAVGGYLGQHLLNTFFEGDATTGTLTSPSFTVTRKYLNLLIGGGGHAWPGPQPTAVNLVVDGQVVRSAAGDFTEQLNWASWDVGEFAGKAASLQVVDGNNGGWGHILLDHVTASDQPALPRAIETAVNLVVDGEVVRTASGEESERLDWVAWDVRDLIGRQAQIHINDFNSAGWGHILVDHIMFSGQPALSSRQRYSWVDYGKDFYAALSFNDVPGGERLWIAWMNNWQYGDRIPTDGWRGAMSLPRRVTLSTVDGAVRLVQEPVRQLRTLRQGPAYHVQNKDIAAGVQPLAMQGELLEIDAEFDIGTATQLGLIVRGDSTGQGTEIGYDASAGTVYIDRSGSGAVDFSGAFPGRHAGPLQARNGRVRLKIYVDRASVEVFGGQGETVLTDQIFPDAASQSLSVFARGGKAQLRSLTVHQLRSAFR